MELNLLLVFVISILVFILSLLLTDGVRYYALRYNLIDHPNQRSSHRIPTPRGGGIAIVLSFFLALTDLWLNHLVSTSLFYALIGGVVIAISGLCDDFYSIKARIRLMIQFATAMFALYILGGLPTLDFGTWQFHLSFFGTLIGIISIVWLINLYNFMDGIDGLAGSEGFFVSLSAGAMTWIIHYHDIAVVFFLLAASILGFTVLNWQPAKIFLGDVGSSFLGYTLAILGIYCIKQTPLSISFWLILLAVFICDASFTVIQRTLSGKTWYLAHREHAYQLLSMDGASHRKITLLILIYNLLILLPSAAISLYFNNAAGIIMLVNIVCLFTIWRFIRNRFNHRQEVLE